MGAGQPISSASPSSLPMARPVRFFVLGDWGEQSAAVARVGASMAHDASTNGVPDFIVSLGDNFYPAGVRSTSDRQFQKTWYEQLVGPYPLLHHVPWKVVLGNHDYGGNVKAQLDFTDDVRNPNGVWQMRGDDSRVAPSRQYAWSRPLPRSRAGDEADGKNDDAVPSDATAVPEPSPLRRADFFVMDTCAAQWSVQRRDSTIKERFLGVDVPWLAEGLGERDAIRALANVERARNLSIPVPRSDLPPPLARSSSSSSSPDPTPATWRIVFGHHPLYTFGKGHLNEARCLRLSSYLSAEGDDRGGPAMQGFAVESVLLAGRADAYFSGHEHIMMHKAVRRPAAVVPCTDDGAAHTTTTTTTDETTKMETPMGEASCSATLLRPHDTDARQHTHFFICGASNETHYYKRKVEAERLMPSERECEFVSSSGGDEGFAVVSLTATEMDVRFRRSCDTSDSYRVTVSKNVPFVSHLDAPAGRSSADFEAGCFPAARLPAVSFTGSTGATPKKVAFQYESRGLWKGFDDASQAILQSALNAPPSRSSTGSVVELLIGGRRYHVDVAKMIQTSEQGTVRRVRFQSREGASAAPTPPDAVTTTAPPVARRAEYLRGNGSWAPTDATTSQGLVAMATAPPTAERPPLLTLSVGHETYHFDLRKMEQQNARTLYSRRIRFV